MSLQCQVCKASLDGHRADARFCSAKCRSRAHNVRLGQSPHTETATSVPNVRTVQTVQPVQNVHEDRSGATVPSVPFGEGVKNERQSDRMNAQLLQHTANDPLRDLLLSDLNELRRKESSLGNTIERLTQRLVDGPKEIRRLNERLSSATAEKSKIQDRLSLSDPDLFDTYLNSQLQRAVADKREFLDMYKAKTRFREPHKLICAKEQALVQSTRDEWMSRVAVLEHDIQLFKSSIADLKSDMETIPRSISLISDQLREIRSVKSRLYAIVKPQHPAPTGRPADITSAIHPMRRSKQQTDMTAEDLRNAYFETFTLPTELGRFLGQLDRNKLAFALTGDSGAGKSHFAFEIAKLFSDEGYRTKIFCLEEGIGHLTQEKLNKYDLSNDVIISGTATLSDVRKAASQFDLIVVDSFGKLDVDASEFENLRADFPQTVFVIIFQKTATGSIRGGASIIFNSAATIDITKNGHDRIATMVKGRYGTQGWTYSINTKLMLQHGN